MRLLLAADVKRHDDSGRDVSGVTVLFDFPPAWRSQNSRTSQADSVERRLDSRKLAGACQAGGFNGNSFTTTSAGLDTLVLD